MINTAKARKANRIYRNCLLRSNGWRYISHAYKQPNSRQAKAHHPETAPHVIENKNSISGKPNMLFLFNEFYKNCHPMQT
jgi:hypothetical protein